MDINFHEVFEQAPVGMLLLSENKIILAWNHWLADKTGKREKDVLGKSLIDLYPEIKSQRFELALSEVIHNKSQQIMSHALNHYLIPINVDYVGGHGLKYMPQQVYIAPIHTDHGVVALVSILDVTENVIRSDTLMKMAHKLEDDSNKDQLTDIFNRRFLWKWLDQQQPVFDRYKEPVSFLLFDVDHFKKINDTFGHDVGDVVLKQFVDLIASCLRETDLLIRYGGEEFIAILTHSDLENSLLTADRIREKIEETGFANLDPGAVTTSIGVSNWNRERGPFVADELVKEADISLYKAKTSGRNKVCSIGDDTC